MRGARVHSTTVRAQGGRAELGPSRQTEAPVTASIPWPVKVTSAGQCGSGCVGFGVDVSMQVSLHMVRADGDQRARSYAAGGQRNSLHLKHEKGR